MHPDPYLYLGLDDIVVDGLNVRSEFDAADLSALADNIDQYGLLSPLVVTVSDSGKYRLVAGERRYRALRHLVETDRKATTLAVPVLVIDGDDDSRLTATMLIENVQRTDLPPLDEARGYQRLAVDHKMKQADIAKAVGKSQAHISKRLALLNLTDTAVAGFLAGKITIDQAYTISRLPIDRQDDLAKRAEQTGRLDDWSIDAAVRAVRIATDLGKITAHLDKVKVPVRTDVGGYRDKDHVQIAVLTADTLKDYKPSNSHIAVLDKHAGQARIYRPATDKEKAAVATQTTDIDQDRYATDPTYAFAIQYRDARQAANAARTEWADQVRQTGYAALVGLTAAQLSKTMLQAVLYEFGATETYHPRRLLGVLGVADPDDDYVDFDHHQEQDFARDRLIDWIGGDARKAVLAALLNLVDDNAVMLAHLVGDRVDLPAEPEMVMPPIPAGYRLDGTRLVPLTDDDAVADEQVAVSDLADDEPF